MYIVTVTNTNSGVYKEKRFEHKDYARGYAHGFQKAISDAGKSHFIDIKIHKTWVKTTLKDKMSKAKKNVKKFVKNNSEFKKYLVRVGSNSKSEVRELNDEGVELCKKMGYGVAPMYKGDMMRSD
tara:strand:+ start:299 stop:673 length:375 start_codon:yes stop_codon:yes gene_type:complete